METLFMFVVALSTMSWVGLALLPWRPWRNQEVLDAMERAEGNGSLGEITVLIPARNEAEVIQQVLQSLIQQGPGLSIVLIDDSSEDATVEKAGQIAIQNLRIIQSAPLPSGWSGKLWVLEQGRQNVTTPYTLLLDADIELAPGMIKALREKMYREGIPFIFLMAVPSMSGSWEKLLMFVFVYFFKVFYPFRRVNSHDSSVAVVAGGCIFLES